MRACVCMNTQSDTINFQSDWPIHPREKEFRCTLLIAKSLWGLPGPTIQREYSGCVCDFPEGNPMLSEKVWFRCCFILHHSFLFTPLSIYLCVLACRVMSSIFLNAWKKRRKRMLDEEQHFLAKCQIPDWSACAHWMFSWECVCLKEMILWTDFREMVAVLWNKKMKWFECFLPSVSLSTSMQELIIWSYGSSAQVFWSFGCHVCTCSQDVPALVSCGVRAVHNYDI